MTMVSPAPSALRTIAADIKIAHSVFALPFALLAAFLAARPAAAEIDWRRFGGQLILIVLAMIAARTFAMLANRWFDRTIDASNPRTADRALPSGRLSERAALTGLTVAAAVFALVCAGFGFVYGNWWPLTLCVPVLAWIGVYGLFKRFTWLCHLYLGSSLALSPLAAALAIDPMSITAQPALWLLACMVLLWVSGFDVIYALQDVESDRAASLQSIPARLGVGPALWISRGLHVAAIACLVGTTLIDPRLGVLFNVGVATVFALLAYEHLTVHRWGTTRLVLAFFTLNGLVSCLLGALGIADVL